MAEVTPERYPISVDVVLEAARAPVPSEIIARLVANDAEEAKTKSIVFVAELPVIVIEALELVNVSVSEPVDAVGLVPAGG